MTDVIGDSTQYHPVNHQKIVWNFPETTLAEQGEYISGSKRVDLYTTGLVSAGPALATNGQNSFPAWDSDYNALLRTLPGHQFGVQDAGLNLPTFLGELRDFKSIFASVGGFLSPKPNKRGTLEWSNLYKQLRAPRIRTVGDAVAVLAKTDLFVQFAAKPFIADIKNMMLLGDHLARQWDRLKSVEPLVSRSAVHDRDTSDLTTPASSPSRHSQYLEREYSRVVTSYVKYRIDTDSVMSEPPARWLLAADALGFDNPISTAWELTPWSFLMDYFVHVGNYLNQFQGNLIDVPHEKIEQGWSVKRTFHSRVTTDFDVGYYRNYFTNVSGGHKAIGTFEKTSYIRLVEELPFGALALPQFRLPNLRQVRLISDLLFLRGRTASI